MEHSCAVVERFVTIHENSSIYHSTNVGLLGPRLPGLVTYTLHSEVMGVPTNHCTKLPRHSSHLD